MAFYVFALVDAPPLVGATRGFSSAVTFQRVAGCFIAVERRADVPPLEMGALQRHDRIVKALWKKVPAILPVRFGTLLDMQDVLDVLDGRDEELQGALAGVRDAAQYTWRSLPHTDAGRTAAPVAARSGTEYLRRAAAQAATVPSRYAGIRGAVAGLVLRERFQPAVANRVERLYHLVRREQAQAYELASGDAAAGASVVLSGPWPPYAFVPELL